MKSKTSMKRPYRSLLRFRTFFQLAFIIAVAVTGFRHAMGWTQTTIETYCPFGGLETALSLFTNSQFACATGERNFALFVALLGLTFLARKSFCGWVCPVGALSEWFRKLGIKVFPKKRKDEEGFRLHALEPSPHIDRWLRWLRLPILAMILYFTFKTGELIFRGYDPFYILFSFHGHDVFWWSYIILSLVLIAVVILPMAWCRYLCPLGIALQPFSAIGRLHLTRNIETCTECKACDNACPHAIRISSQKNVTSGDCIMCFECLDACPSKDTLELKFHGGLR